MASFGFGPFGTTGSTDTSMFSGVIVDLFSTPSMGARATGTYSGTSGTNGVALVSGLPDDATAYWLQYSFPPGTMYASSWNTVQATDPWRLPGTPLDSGTISLLGHTGDPATDVSRGKIYSKLYGSIYELYYKDTAGNAVKITNNGGIATTPAAPDDDSAYLPLIGGTMLGTLSMGGFGITSMLAPVGTGSATTKAYVDAADALNLPLSGGTMAGSISMGGFGITNLASSVGTGDALWRAHLTTPNDHSADVIRQGTTNLFMTAAQSGKVNATLIPMCFGYMTGINKGITTYLHPKGGTTSTTEANVQWKCNIPGTVQNVRIYVATNGIPNTSTITLRQNTNPIVTLTVGATGVGEYTSATTFTVTPGDLISWGVVTFNSGTNIMIGNFQFDISPLGGTVL